MFLSISDISRFASAEVGEGSEKLVEMIRVSVVIPFRRTVPPRERKGR